MGVLLEYFKSGLGGGSESAIRAKAKVLFDQIDVDGSGELDADELIKVFETRGVISSKGVVDKVGAPKLRLFPRNKSHWMTET